MNSRELFQLGVGMSYRACPYCSVVPLTNDPRHCVCKIDCHAEWCGRVASGEPEYESSQTPLYDVITPEDMDPNVQRGRDQLRAEIAAYWRKHGRQC